jgi:Ras association domain-containing protein 7/8
LFLPIKEFQETKGQNQTVNQIAGQGQNMVTVAYTQRYVELIRLVNRQRDTINAQQADLTKVIKSVFQALTYFYSFHISIFNIKFQYDAEILYWENKNREQMHQMDFISQEVNRIESSNRVIEDQVYITVFNYNEL